jgi:hypothetical protein
MAGAGLDALLLWKNIIDVCNFKPLLMQTRFIENIKFVANLNFNHVIITPNIKTSSLEIPRKILICVLIKF